VSSVAYGYKGAKTIRTDLVPLLAFGRTAADCIARLVQGSRIMVDGHLHEDRWDVGRGASRSRLLVVADHVHFLSDPLHRGFRPTTDLSQKSMATRFASSY
jgi:single-stranded DNA-binding protein